MDVIQATVEQTVKKLVATFSKYVFIVEKKMDWELIEHWFLPRLRPCYTYMDVIIAVKSVY